MEIIYGVETFLGAPIQDWIAIQRVAHRRNININQLREIFEKQNPISYYAWKEYFGILAELAEMEINKDK